MSCETLFAIIVSVPAGILCSLAAWWILFHNMAPQVAISGAISKLPDKSSPSGFTYRVKIANQGRRDAIDLKVQALLRVKALNPDFPSNWSIARLRLETSQMASMQGRQGNLIIRMYPERTRKLKQWKDEKGNSTSILSVESLLGLGSEADIQFVVFAYDRFSGARKVFESKRYGASDVVDGRFVKDGLDVRPL